MLADGWMDGCKSENFGSEARLDGPAGSAAAGAVMGTLSALMNNGEEAGMGGGEKHSIGDRRRRRTKEGVRQRCSSDRRGGSSTEFVSLRCFSLL